MGKTNSVQVGKPKAKTGVAPERVKTDKPWDSAVKDALSKKRPAGGWPQDKKPKK